MREQTLFSRPLLFILLALLVVVAVVSQREVSAVEVTDLSPANQTLFGEDGGSALNCRFGIGTGGATLNWVEHVGAGTYVNYNDRSNPLPNADYIHTIRIKEDSNFVGSNENDPRDWQWLGTYFLRNYNNPTHQEDLDQLADLVANNPGDTWLIGNEPDRVRWQDHMTPEVYAYAYNELYYVIKGADPTARVGIGALVQATPNRLNYLDQVWDTYQTNYQRAMPIDVWNMHLYILPEKKQSGVPSDIASWAIGTNGAGAYFQSDGTANMCTNPNDNTYCFAEHDNMTIFQNQVLTMRQWMKDHNQQNKPLIISEFGQLYSYIVDPGGCFLSDEFGNCFDPNRVTQFMENAINYLNTATDPSLGYSLDGNRLVQQWVWFPLFAGVDDNGDPDVGQSSTLLVENYEDFAVGDLDALTQMGHKFRELATAGPIQPNLVIDAVGHAGAVASPVDIGVIVRNNGNTAITNPVEVTFYSDAAMTNVIGTVTIDPVLQGCARNVYEVSVPWTLGGPGVYNFWVEVDSADAIVESNEGDNDGVGTVVIDDQPLFLPIIENS